MKALGAIIDWWIARAGVLPTTNVRTATTIVAFVAVVVVWLGLAIVHAFFPAVVAWEPSGTMLTFLSVWGGLDVVQFGVKRKTHDAAAVPRPSSATS